MAKNTVKRNKGKQASLKTSKANPMTGKKQSAKSRKRAASDVSGSHDGIPTFLTRMTTRYDVSHSQSQSLTNQIGYIQ